MTFAVTAILIFVLSVLFERKLIPFLRSKKLGQPILEIGPRWHKCKEGTPTMGGIGFILPTLFVMAVFFVWRASIGDSADFIPLALTLGFAVANGAIGFIDDYFKLVKKQNEGLTWKQKLFLQLFMASCYVCVMAYTGNMDTSVALPFSDREWEMGWFYYPAAVIVLTGVVNGGNFTDGLDGLDGSVTCVAGIFFAVWAFARKDFQLSLIGAILIGSTLGFLVYNIHPAKVFMGDTGSLFLGALVIGAAFASGEEIVGLIISAVFIVEMLSSFSQTLFFKLTRRLTGEGKRLFRMAPLHHHFEKCGWNEPGIVIVFSLVETIACMIAWLAL
ncbi:MAG: phospho-N-acetylmuramoyl-pentapeptide-transferase [Clostridia bacterium]|nr:phospho-N-acetylmuramoyl-pentapeptide-transferase [Clostridia bacterium]